jgi:hypothetical protein
VFGTRHQQGSRNRFKKEPGSVPAKFIMKLQYTLYRRHVTDLRQEHVRIFTGPAPLAGIVQLQSLEQCSKMQIKNWWSVFLRVYEISDDVFLQSDPCSRDQWGTGRFIPVGCHHIDFEIESEEISTTLPLSRPTGACYAAP